MKHPSRLPDFPPGPATLSYRLYFSSISGETCMLTSVLHLSFFLFSAAPSLLPEIPLPSAAPTHALPHPAPLCLNSFGPREQTKKGLCPERKRWCVTRRGDNVSAGSAQSSAPCPSPRVCLPPINFHQGAKMRRSLDSVVETQP